MRSLSLAFLVVLVGCATQPAAPPSVHPPQVEHAPGIYEVRSGTRIDEQTLWQRLRDVPFVLVAESHDSPEDHAVQLRVYRALSERSEAPVALGMEMFQRPFQSALDAYVAGEIDEATMLRRTQWEKRWGFATELYRPLWQAAREHHSPIVALNVRRELTKRVSRVGIDGVTDTERADLPQMDLTSARYRRWMREIFAAHGAEMSPERFERFFQAQVLWDETMAQTAVEFLAAHEEVAQMVIAAGRGHIERDFGIPSRIRRRLDGSGARVVSIVPLASPAPSFGWMREAVFADYVWIR